MTALVILAVYTVGLLPAAARTTRWYAERGHCHHEDRSGGRDRFNHASLSWCRQFHRKECWRPDGEVQVRDLLAAPLALVWPLALVGVVILARARKLPNARHLQQQIDDLERELGIGGSR